MINILNAHNCNHLTNTQKLFLILTNIFFLILGLKNFESINGKLTLISFFISSLFHTIQVTIGNCNELNLCCYIDIIIVTFLILNIVIFNFKSFKNFNVIFFLIIGLLFFSYNIFYKDNYHIYHSLWHIFSSLSLYFYFKSVKKIHKNN